MASGRQGTKTQQAAAEADQVFDPKYEWQESDTSFVLRLHLSGFRKEDFRVQVDGSGRLTVRGQRTGGGKHSRFNKVFQLPVTSNLDGITGRFDAGVLSLTVPKKVGDAKPKEDANNAPPPPPAQGQVKPKEDEAKKPEAQHKEAAEMTTTKKPTDDAKPKEAKDDAATSKKPPAAAEQQVDAKGGKPEHEQRKAAPPPAAVTKEEAKPKAEAAAPPPAVVTKEEAKPKAEAAAPPATDEKQATPKPPQADAERKAVDPESLTAVASKRRAEEERAKAAAAAAAEEAERRRTCRGFRERVAEELQGLAGSEWAEGLVETVKKNKEMIAAAVAGFSLGVFVSSRLFSRN